MCDSRCAGHPSHVAFTEFEVWCMTFFFMSARKDHPSFTTTIRLASPLSHLVSFNSILGELVLPRWHPQCIECFVHPLLQSFIAMSPLEQFSVATHATPSNNLIYACITLLLVYKMQSKNLQPPQSATHLPKRPSTSAPLPQRKRRRLTLRPWTLCAHSLRRLRGWTAPRMMASC